MSAERLSHNEDEVKVPGSLSVAHLLMELDEQWPSFKFLGFGCYYAWIWLCYNSSILVRGVSEQTAATDTVFTVYLWSTSAVAVMLIVAPLILKATSKLVNSRPFILVVSAVAAVSTILVSFFADAGVNDIGFIINSILTGVATSWIALRLGTVYSRVSARQSVMYTAASFVFACMLYFMAIGLPDAGGLLFTACLPVVAALFTMTMPSESQSCPNTDDLGRRLPYGFFVRLVAMIAVFSMIVGVTRGFSTLQQSVGTLNMQGVVIAAGTAGVAAAIFMIVGLTVRNFDISKLYYPTILIAALGILIMPLFGGAESVSGSYENQFIGIAYALFIMVIWCLCAHVSYAAELNPVRVFGLGRGASAAGTTIGWLLGSKLVETTDADPTIIIGISIAMVLVLFTMAMLVFNNQTIAKVLGQLRDQSKDFDTERMRDIFPSVAPDALEPDGSSTKKVGAWTKSCLKIAESYKLSPRERDVLFLLSKGRSIDYASNDLGVSFNTAKTHIRNVYAKVGVHSRQELLDMIERNK